MPRGRRGLSLIPPERVRAALIKHRFGFSFYGSAHINTERTAHTFGVTARTVRRWLLTGLPLSYGDDSKPSFITSDVWEHFEEKGTVVRQPGQRTGNDRRLSASSRSRTGSGRRLSARSSRARHP
jgi:hypothetical protein